MPAISLASAADLTQARDLRAGRYAQVRKPSPMALVPEAVRVAIAQGCDDVMSLVRGTWFYRQTLTGQVPVRIHAYTDDYRARVLQDADALMRGRFRLGGHAVDIRQGSIFDQKPPCAAFAAALHGFDWLRHLEAAGGDLARDFALKLTQHWLNRNARYAAPAWRPEVTAERLINLFCHGRFFLGDLDETWRSKFFTSLRDQSLVLTRSLHRAPDGLPRLKGAAALSLAGLCLADDRFVGAGLKRFSAEIDRQILPDGGHVSRSPAQLLDVARLLTMLKQALALTGREPDPALDQMLDRTLLLLKFFRMGDGALAVFGGGGEEDARIIAGLVAQDQRQDQRLTHLSESGYHRLALGRGVVLFDAGAPAEGAFSTGAHAGCLSFEMSSGAHRLVVNCGAFAGGDPSWQRALRSTPAHSTLTLDERSQATVLTEGFLARLLGPRLIGGPIGVEMRRLESAHGLSVEASHDAYVAHYGLVHQRRMTLSRGGFTLTGADRIVPVNPNPPSGHRDARNGVPYAIRFHIHPDVKLSLAQGGSSVILKLPNREGWRFRCGGGDLSVEESIYFGGGGSSRRTEQIVIRNSVKAQAAESAWVFEQVGSA
jgi:uncharacterized heparinase superfamily protein